MQQMTLFPEEREYDFNHRPFPFASQYARDDFGHSGQFVRFDKVTSEYLFTPHFWKPTRIYKCMLTGKTMFAYYPLCKLPADFYKTDAEKAAEAAAERERIQRAQAQTKKRKPRKPYKWSTAAKVRNRQRLLRRRIEKQFGYDPDRPDLFDGDTLLAIESEFHDQIHEHPNYFIRGK